MNVVLAHASRETPVSFPGWKGYPPSYNQNGTWIDYALQSNGGVFAQRQLTASSYAQGPRAIKTAGNSSWEIKSKDRQYQSELRHMRGTDLNIKIQGPYVTARTR